MNIKDKLEAGEFITLAEIEPPKGVDVLAMVSNANQVKHKVDAFVIPELSNAVMRISSLGGALMLQNKGMTTLMQVNCRDRNRLALQADILAAAAAGVSGIIAVPAVDPRYGDHPEAAAVYDLDTTQLIQASSGLQQGLDMAGNPLSGAAGLIIGAGIDAGARNDELRREVSNAKANLAAGATFLVSTPLVDLDDLNPFLEEYGGGKATIIPTVLVLKSVGMARYIAQTQTHITITDDLIERIRSAGDKSAECVRIARETIAAVRHAGFGGVIISTFGWEHKLPEILR